MSRNQREGRYVGHGRHQGRWAALRSHHLRVVGRAAVITEKRARALVEGARLAKRLDALDALFELGTAQGWRLFR
jgi:hypothetical protein